MHTGALNRSWNGIVYEAAWDFVLAFRTGSRMNDHERQRYHGCTDRYNVSWMQSASAKASDRNTRWRTYADRSLGEDPGARSTLSLHDQCRWKNGYRSQCIHSSVPGVVCTALKPKPTAFRCRQCTCQRNQRRMNRSRIVNEAYTTGMSVN